MLDLIDMGCFREILMYFTLICAEIRLEFGLSGIAGCLICLIGDFLEGGWKVLEGWIHRDCLFLLSFDVFFFWIHRNLMFSRHPDVSGMCGFMHIHRKCPMYGLSDVLLL